MKIDVIEKKEIEIQQEKNRKMKKMLERRIHRKKMYKRVFKKEI